MIMNDRVDARLVHGKQLKKENDMLYRSNIFENGWWNGKYTDIYVE
jgi:hypothetical protein